MASESYFRNSFCKEIISTYSKEKLTNSRIQSIWGAVKNFHDDALAAALREVTKPEFFPGADKIIEACILANANYKNAEIARAKASGECSLCSNGLRQVNNFSYRCSCKLGQLMFPAYPEYDGQPQFQEKRYIDEEGYAVLETRTHIYRSKPGSSNPRDFTFTLKDLPQSKPKQEFNKPRLIKANNFDMDKF